MSPYYADDLVTLYQGDARAVLRTLPAASVNCCVTSPPYWGLRAYGTDPLVWGGDAGCGHDWQHSRYYVEGGGGAAGSKEAFSEPGEANAERIKKARWREDDTCRKCGAWRGEYGLEPTPALYVEHTVEIFREVRRVLRDDGTLWLNLGSSYVASPRGNKPGDYSTSSLTNPWRQDDVLRGNGPSRSPSQRRARACGNDGRGLRDSTASDSSCSGLCDECLADFLNHHARTSGTAQPNGRSLPQPLPTDRDNEPSDSASTSAAASPLGALESTILQSWRQHRGACSRCDSRASALATAHSSPVDALAFSRMTWLDYTTRLKQKDMIPIPWMVAMALQADGWYLRSDIIWSKPNPMPESVTDRCTKSHEYIFMLSKSERYFFNADAIKEPMAEDSPGRYRYEFSGTDGADEVNDRRTVPAGMRVPTQGKHSSAEPQSAGRRMADSTKTARANGRDHDSPFGFVRNKRSVWTVTTQPCPLAHFATFPPKLIEPCILAGTPNNGCVLDPFFGAGTTGLVCQQQHVRCVGIELNPDYCAIAKARLSQSVLPFTAKESA